jgi:hypothetical protein
LDGYGIGKISLHPAIWAQTGGTGNGNGSGNGSGGGSDTGSGGSGSENGTDNGTDSGSGNGTLWERADSDCEYYFEGKANATITILGGITIKLNGEGKATYIARKGATNCKSGGYEQCMARYCPVIPGSN